MTKKDEQTLLVFKRKIFRRMYGPKYENLEWKSRTNQELEEMSKGENIVKWIKGQRIRWLGHLERMEEDRMPKKIVAQELEGTRQRGRPRKRWKEEVGRDLQVLGVRRWRELVTDTNKIEGYCSTGQSPQWAVVPMEEEDESYNWRQLLPLNQFVEHRIRKLSLVRYDIGVNEIMSAY
jgi:hypothetical protein